MLAELKAKSQLTIPNKIVKQMGLETGDMFDVVSHGDGIISLIPVVVYPKSRIEELERLATEAREDLKNGNMQRFKTADEAIAALHIQSEKL